MFIFPDFERRAFMGLIGRAGTTALRIRGPVAGLAASTGLAAAAAAVAVELGKPKEERTWQGKLVGVVPYDLRWPTPGRVARSVWAPDDDRFLVPRAFGVGWSLNLARVAEAVREASDREGLWSLWRAFPSRSHR